MERRKHGLIKQTGILIVRLLWFVPMNKKEKLERWESLMVRWGTQYLTGNSLGSRPTYHVVIYKEPLLLYTKSRTLSLVFSAEAYCINECFDIDITPIINN